MRVEGLKAKTDNELITENSMDSASFIKDLKDKLYAESKLSKPSMWRGIILKFIKENISKVNSITEIDKILTKLKEWKNLKETEYKKEPHPHNNNTNNMNIIYG